MGSKVLIVEDEQEIADALRYALSSDGFDPAWVATGEQALTDIQQGGVDFCILDVGLPDWNGFELLKELRKESDVPVLILTARNEEIDRIVGLEIGADDYVCKPFSPREVVARVKAILKRGRSVEKENGEFVHEIDARTISYLGQPLDLTRSEYCLLEAFLEQPNRVFSRRQLIERVWSSNHPSEDRVIDTHVKSLRAKLRTQDKHKEFIITHRGFGYSFKA